MDLWLTSDSILLRCAFTDSGSFPNTADARPCRWTAVRASERNGHRMLGVRAVGGSSVPYRLDTATGTGPAGSGTVHRPVRPEPGARCPGAGDVTTVQDQCPAGRWGVRPGRWLRHRASAGLAPFLRAPLPQLPRSRVRARCPRCDLGHGFGRYLLGKTSRTRVRPVRWSVRGRGHVPRSRPEVRRGTGQRVFPR